MYAPNPLSVAIVGFGPSGAYVAGHLLSNTGIDARVDVFERLPTPWGLVRAGVAPDHPKIKAVTRVYEQTAQDPRLRYFGNVQLGAQVTRDDLLARYHAVIYAFGAPAERPLSIPGERLAGCITAGAFVGWYNGHPDHRDHSIDLSGRRAVVIGAGNVALDVARMLTLAPAQLARTDIADHALQALAHSRIEEVVVVGRRGPEQAAFTDAELRELGELADVDLDVDPVEVSVPARLRERRPSRGSQRNLALLLRYAGRPARGRPRRIALRFLLSPTRVLGDDRVRAVELVRNGLVRGSDGRLHARPTGAGARVPAGLVLSAVGYRGLPIDGVPFDERRGTVANLHGRVRHAHAAHSREYVVGWAKRGPTGTIGTNKRCALETVRVLLQDMLAGRLDAPIQGAPAVEAFLRSRQPELVQWADWEAIDRHERSLGQAAQRPRVKLTRVHELLDAAAGERRLSA